MTNSIFYNLQEGLPFPVPLLALETYSVQSHGISTEEGHMDLFIKVISGLCKVVEPTEDDLSYFIDRLRKVQEEIDSKSPRAKVSRGRSFGTSYHAYLSGLTLDSTILRMTGYNFEAARKIYCDLDRDDAMRLVDEYVRGVMEESLVSLESSMYGMGGSYKDDGKQSREVTHDLTTEEGKAALRAAGF